MTWQKQLQQAIRQPNELLKQINLTEREAELSEKANAEFSLLAPDSYLSNIKAGDFNDPLLKQILPVAEEEIESSDSHQDPVGDLQSQKTPGLLHKYHGRVLLIVTGACPIHCRFCFRRHYPYSDNSISSQALMKALNYIIENPDISEVILSGGDPLTLTDQKLFNLIQELEKIKHVKRLRIHTRTPIVLPERIIESDLEWLSNTRLKTVMVVHCNHANEINQLVINAIKSLHDKGVTLFNQSVLLKDINDNAESLIELSEKLFELNIKPYYLHLLDPVKGAMHFDVDEATAITLHKQVKQRLPGYLVPALVKETPGELAKILIQ